MPPTINTAHSLHIEFDKPLLIKLSAASKHEPDLLTINFGSGSESQFPSKFDLIVAGCPVGIATSVDGKIRTLSKGSTVILHMKPHGSKVLWPWAWRVNRKGQSMATHHMDSGCPRPKVGLPTEITVYAIDLIQPPVCIPTR